VPTPPAPPPPPASIHLQLLTAIAEAIQDLLLSGVGGVSPLPPAQVYVKKLPTDRASAGILLPAIVVSLVPLPEKFATVMNAADDYGYPCLVTIIAANNQDLSVSDDELLWRQTIRNYFHNQKPKRIKDAISPVPLGKILVEPYPILDLNLFQQQNLFVSSLLVRCWTREVRVRD